MSKSDKGGLPAWFFLEAPLEWCPPGVTFGRAVRDIIMSEHAGEFAIDLLVKHNLGVAIAMRELDDDLVVAIRMLNQVGIPVKFWIVLPDEDGYWSNVRNVSLTIARTNEVIHWATRYDLSFESIGFDNEWPIQTAILPKQGHPIRFVWEVLGFLFSRLKIGGQSNEMFLAYLLTLEEKGIVVEHYTFSDKVSWFMGGGLNGLSDNRFVEMVYTSMMPKAATGVVLEGFWDQGNIPAIGIINGVPGETPGRDLGKKLPRHYTDDELEAVLSYVLRQKPQELYVFALNHVRCLQQYLRVLSVVLANLHRTREN